MYRCQRCKADVTAEVEREISSIVSSAAPGQGSFPGMIEYFEQRYVCRACNLQEAAATAAAEKAARRRG